MKTTSLLLLICVAFFATSCSQNKGANGKNNQSHSADSIALAEEDFESFLVNFSNKPTFQRQRVMFPIEATLLDPTEYGVDAVDEKITYQEWILIDFSYDSTFVTRQMDSYKQHVRVYNDSSIIEHRGIDNGIYANYYFVKKDGKWFLKSFTDVFY
ncbi:MAG: DUF4348 domain-containing protein [Bacteroidales bacterium]|jgi:hypothetical protein|nr:DUF4348 domain-containing protein [Bacteroidales bacterium]